MKKNITRVCGGAGAVIGANAVVFRVIDLISYSEMKMAMLLALAMLGTAYAIEKLITK